MSYAIFSLIVALWSAFQPLPKSCNITSVDRLQIRATWEVICDKRHIYVRYEPTMNDTRFPAPELGPVFFTQGNRFDPYTYMITETHKYRVDSYV